MIKAILFDLDGTLADTAPDLGNALNRQLQLHGLPILPLEVIRPHASHGARGLLKIGFNLKPEDEKFIAMRDEFLNLYAERLCHDTTLFPGTLEVLAELEKQALPWGIVTNKVARFTLPLLEQLQIRHRAACVISGDTCSKSKPHPDPLLEASRCLAIEPEYCVYVGDAARDIEAGLAAGMHTVVAKYGYLGDEEDPIKWNADAMIETPYQLIEYLKT
jgi:phosphoglycolate phosphatase